MTIRDTLILEDRFSANFSRYINLGNRAANANRLATSAAQNYQSVINALDRRLISLNAQFNAGLARQQEMIRAGMQNTDAFRQLDRELERLGQSIRDTRQQYGSLVDEMEEATREAERFERATTGMSNGLGSITGMLKGLAAGYLSFQGLSSLVGLSDTMSQTNARLDMMNDGLQTTAELNQMVYESAQRSHGSYQDMVDMVAKLGTLAGDAFNSSAEIVAFSEQISKHMVLSSASSSDAQAAILQLTQAMSSGALRGEELNSILEHSPTIMEAISKYMGVTTGEARELASQGAITANVVKNAVFAMSEEVNERFGKMGRTWESLWINSKNAALKAISPILDAINEIPDNIDKVGKWVDDNKNIVVAAFAAIATAAAIAGASALFSAASSAAAWLAAVWPVLLVAAAIGGIIYLAREAGATWQEIGGVIGGLFGLWYAQCVNFFIAPMWNAFANTANFIGNVFKDPIGAVKVAFWGLATDVLSYLSTMIHGVEDLINLIPGVKINITGSVDRILETVKGKYSEAKNASEWTEYVKKMNYVDWQNAWNTGSNYGTKAGDFVENFNASEFFNETISKLFDYVPYDQLNTNVNDMANDVNSIKKSVNLADEDIKSLVDIAERKFVANVNLTAQSPVINVSGQNTGNTAADRKALADTIRDMLIEQAAASTMRSTARAF